jgi:hypothetical protein
MRAAVAARRSLAILRSRVAIPATWKLQCSMAIVPQKLGCQRTLQGRLGRLGAAAGGRCERALRCRCCATPVTVRSRRCRAAAVSTIPSETISPSRGVLPGSHMPTHNLHCQVGRGTFKKCDEVAVFVEDCIRRTAIILLHNCAGSKGPSLGLRKEHGKRQRVRAACLPSEEV